MHRKLVLEVIKMADMKGPGPKGPITIEKAKNSGRAARRIIQYLGKNKFLFIMLLIMVMLAAGTSLFTTPWQQKSIDTIKITDGIPHVDMPALLQNLTIYLLFALAAVLFNFLQGWLGATLSQKTVKTMRNDLFSKMSYLPIRFFDTHTHGELMSRLTNDVDNVSNMLSQSMTSLISSMITVIGSLIMMIYYSSLMTIITLLAIPMGILVSRLVTKKTRKYFQAQQKSLGQLNGHIEEMVTGQRTVQAFNREKIAMEQFDAINKDLRKYSIKAQIYSGAMGPLMNVVSNLTFALVAIAGGLIAIYGGGISVGTIAAFITLSRQFTRPINEMANQYNMIQSAIAGAERVFEIMDEQPEEDHGSHPFNLNDVKGNILFSHVQFGYVKGETVLKDFDIRVNAGQKIALVGPTGAGKTTVVNLLTRFYEINAGNITLDGIPIEQLQKSDLRRCIGIVLQDTVLFTGTIRENIRFGRLDATDDEVEQAAIKANAHGFISRLPLGYNTLLSEAGSNLSQGQRQLLNIARAVLLNPKILILDEATSSIETRTEMHVQQAMIALMKGRTSFIIAHRLSTIRDADAILVISDGQIVESGNHESLLNKKGFYYQLYMTQFANE